MFVLSFTETNIIFAIPKPPTKSENPAIKAPAIFSAAKMPSKNWFKPSKRFTAKLASCLGLIERNERIKPVTSPSNSSCPISSSIALIAISGAGLSF